MSLKLAQHNPACTTTCSSLPWQIERNKRLYVACSDDGYRCGMLYKPSPIAAEDKNFFPWPMTCSCDEPSRCVIASFRKHVCRFGSAGRLGSTLAALPTCSYIVRECQSYPEQVDVDSLGSIQSHSARMGSLESGMLYANCAMPNLPDTCS